MIAASTLYSSKRGGTLPLPESDDLANEAHRVRDIAGYGAGATWE
jgi:hypothetical protein